jgi:hypothetical protein
MATAIIQVLYFTSGSQQSVRQLSSSLNWTWLHLEVLVEEGDALLLIARTYSQMELTSASNYYRSASIERKRARK